METDNSQAAMSAANRASRLKSLKAKRGHIKGQCTRFRSYLDELDIRNVTVVELRQRLKRFSENWELFNSLQADIEELDTESEEVAINYEERNAFERRYFEIASELEFLIESRASPLGTASQGFGDIREGTPATQESTTPNDRLKLPRVNLPLFSGCFEDWIPFRNMFLSMIDQNSSLPNVQKMQYLLASLQGEARDVISALDTSDVNYAEAWNMLLERYDDLSLIVQKHIKALFSLPSIPKENHSALRRMIDSVLKHLRALKSLQRPTDQWDDLMVHIITSRLDYRTNRAWEATLKRGDLPNTKQLLDFLTQYCRSLEASDRTQRLAISSEKIHPNKSTSVHVAAPASNCVYCGGQQHAIYGCKNYLQLDVQKRVKEAKLRKLCLNCLRGTGHQAKNCGSGSCRKCGKRHNTLLHYEQVVSDKSDSSINESELVKTESVTATITSHVSIKSAKQVLLATAIVNVSDSRGHNKSCRALLDSGSQSCFVTLECVRKLGLKTCPTSVPIYGLGSTATQAHQRVEIQLTSRINTFKAELSCLVVNQITQAMPTHQINVHDLQMPKGIQLADPKFYESAQIDLLLGAEIFFDLMRSSKIKISKNQPIWQDTYLGWIVTGNVRIKSSKHNMSTVCNLITNEQLNESIAKFWRIENSGRLFTRSPQERWCEDHFSRTYTRNDQGRFIVSLPIKDEIIEKLGESKNTAIQRLLSLEKKLVRNKRLKEDYVQFMREYLRLQHMRVIQEDNSTLEVQPRYYLPHHCVIKETSTTTKLRVVFDASAKTTSGVSLNDALMVGPVIQQDLFSILIRFRSFKYAIAADITKMYRQILLNTNQTALQRIVWRDDPEEEIKTYELQTVTYGLASASFLATRVLHELASLGENQFPKASTIVRRDFYMDDLISGANSLEEALLICQQTISLLEQGGFELRKWASNCEVLSNNISKELTNQEAIELDKEEIYHTLGVKWNYTEDVFQYSINVDLHMVPSKRSILSAISKIFDPLGLLAPVLVSAKVIMQRLWKTVADWDEPLSGDILVEWTKYAVNLSELKDFKIQRRVLEFKSGIVIQLHGFCDASELAYGACIYIRTCYQQETTQIHLLCAKSKVAPVRAISIPKLELCGAQLLSQLMSKVASSLEINIDKTYYWTDSSIVLHWIKTTNKKLPVFIAHRVGEIQELSTVKDWYHVTSKENPADLVSRGSSTRELLQSQLWWQGPVWLREFTKTEPYEDTRELEDIAAVNEKGVQENQYNTTVLTTSYTADVAHMRNLFDRFFSFTKLIRVIALCIRFSRIALKRNTVEPSQSLTADELEYARKSLIRLVQQEVFSKELETLHTGRNIANNSSIKGLNPFIDSQGLLRVGGRLVHADLQYTTKHQLILPQRSKLTEMIILYEHQRTLHSGIDATLAAVRHLYWPIRARGTVKRLIHQCITCFKSKPRFSEQLMGSLPIKRVTISRPFTNTGIDFCGPIYLREGSRRGAKSIKAYIAVFICMAIKAVHLEVVSNLTIDAFLSAFKRFISRRGKPADVFSDNGTNFVGANKELEGLKQLFLRERNKIIDHIAIEGIRWHFIPPRSPHFGGLWEASVKAFKRYFYKITSAVPMTFEEAVTLTSQIEAILNSKPLTALSADHNSLGYLSPGHFLIGDAIISYPEPDLQLEKLNRLSRWQAIEQMRQHFWRRWSSEYLLNLQQRSKWKNNKGPQLQVGQLVLIKEDNLPPLKWALGRIQELCPGDDRVTRAAIVKTASGVFKRPAAKLCILPIENPESHDLNKNS